MRGSFSQVMQHLGHPAHLLSLFRLLIFSEVHKVGGFIALVLTQVAALIICFQSLWR